MNPSLIDLSDSLTALIEAASASVVGVDGRRGYALSGVAVAPDLIVTTSRAVEREDGLEVTLPDGERLEAALIGRDPRADLALLRVPGTELEPTTWAEAGTLRVGQMVLRLGRPAGGLTATLGVLSSVGHGGRGPGASPSTDAATFRGFSGGPLFTLKATAVGLGTAAWRGGDALIPAATVARVAASLLEHGRVRRPYLGIGTQPVRLPEARLANLGQAAGLLIVSVEPGSAADTAGLTLGDVLLTVGSQPVQHPRALLAQLDGYNIGDIVRLRLLRGGEMRELEAQLGERAFGS